MVLTFRPMDSVQCTAGCGCLDFHSKRFSSLLCDEACPFRNQQAVRWPDGDHSSIWDSWPIAFSGHPRGPSVVCETRCPKHAAPNLSAETRSRTRVSREPDGHRQRRSPGWSGSAQRHSSCLWFQMLGVEAHSSLPYDQYDGGNLPRQGQPRHFRPHALGQQFRVELLERARLSRGDDRRTFGQILQIVIAIRVQPANRNLLLCPFELSFHHPVIGAAVRLDAQPAVGPQLPLGPEAVRGLQNAQQLSRTNRADRGNLAEAFPSLVLLAFCQQIPPYFLAQQSQRIQLLVVKLGPPAHSRLADLPNPLGPMAGCIDLLAGTGNGPAAVQRLHSRHDSSKIFRNREITTHQFLQRS